MAVPQRRTSKTRKRLRRANYKFHLAGVSVCEHCGEYVKPHTVCKKCGYYDGKQVIKIGE